MITDTLVIFQMLTAIGKVSGTLAAVTELHLRIRLVRDSTCGTNVEVVGRFPLRCCARCPLPHRSLARPNASKNVRTKEQEVVQDRRCHLYFSYPTTFKERQGEVDARGNRQPTYLNRKDEQDQKLECRIQRGECEENREIDIGVSDV